MALQRLPELLLPAGETDSCQVVGVQPRGFLPFAEACFDVLANTAGSRAGLSLCLADPGTMTNGPHGPSAQ